MELTGVKTKAALRGPLLVPGPWQGAFARQSWRVYPYQLGCTVRKATTNGVILTYGLGEFLVDDYVLPCRPTMYGDSPFYIPQLSAITKVTVVSSIDDELTTSPARTLAQDDLLINLGADLAATPTSAPNYDGSRVDLYTDNAGVNLNSNKYVLTGTGGQFQGWIEAGYQVVDLLITDAEGIPRLAVPFHLVGPNV